MLHNATLYKTQVSSNAKSPSSIEGIRTVGQKSPAHPRALASTRVHVIFLLVTCSVFEQIHFGEVLASRRTKKTNKNKTMVFTTFSADTALNSASWLVKYSATPGGQTTS